MTDAWARFWMAMAVMAAATAFALGVESDNAVDWAGWAQFAGSMVALGVVWWFSRQEARDRRAEAAALAFDRETAAARRVEDRADRVEQWVDALRSAARMMANATRSAQRVQPDEASFEAMRFTVGRLIRQSEGGLHLLLKFEPPSYSVGSYLVTALEYLAPARSAFDRFNVGFGAQNMGEAQQALASGLERSALLLDELLDEYFTRHDD